MDNAKIVQISENVGTIRELSVFEKGQVATYPYKIKKQAKIVKYREVFLGG